LDYELNTYKIKPEGVVTLPGTYYLKQEITSTIANMPNNMRIMMSKLLYFFKKNDIAMSGKPFVIYDSFDTSKGITRFSVCIPVRDEIYTAPGSDIGYGQTTTVRAVKTTLQGDYSHLREAWAKSNSFIKDNKLAASGNGQIERYVFSREDSKSPSKWITEIYIPVDEPAPAKPDVSPQRAVVNQLEEDVHNQEISIP
ncbi:MAG TPA: GyrI-like domain-containing protein, partial [Flavobacterium sp.]